MYDVYYNTIVTVYLYIWGCDYFEFEYSNGLMSGTFTIRNAIWMHKDRASLTKSFNDRPCGNVLDLKKSGA